MSDGPFQFGCKWSRDGNFSINSIIPAGAGAGAGPFHLLCMQTAFGIPSVPNHKPTLQQPWYQAFCWCWVTFLFAFDGSH